MKSHLASIYALMQKLYENVIWKLMCGYVVNRDISKSEHILQSVPDVWYWKLQFENIVKYMLMNVQHP